MKRVIRFNDGDQMDEDNSYLPWSIVARMHENQNWDSDMDARIKGSWIVAVTVVKVRK